MKIQALVIAAALASGAALAQAPNDTAKAPATDAAVTASTDTAKPTKAAKKVAKKNKKAATKTMGAGAMSPETDLAASDRQARIDDAYAKWSSSASK